MNDKMNDLEVRLMALAKGGLEDVIASGNCDNLQSALKQLDGINEEYKENIYGVAAGTINKALKGALEIGNLKIITNIFTATQVLNRESKIYIDASRIIECIESDKIDDKVIIDFIRNSAKKDEVIQEVIKEDLMNNDLEKAKKIFPVIAKALDMREVNNESSCACELNYAWAEIFVYSKEKELKDIENYLYNFLNKQDRNVAANIANTVIELIPTEDKYKEVFKYFSDQNRNGTIRLTTTNTLKINRFESFLRSQSENMNHSV